MRLFLTWYLFIGVPFLLVFLFPSSNMNCSFGEWLEVFFEIVMIFSVISIYCHERFYWEWIALKGNGFKIYEAPKSNIPFESGDLWKKDAPEDGFQVSVNSRTEPYLVKDSDSTESKPSFNLYGLDPS